MDYKFDMPKQRLTPRQKRKSKKTRWNTISGELFLNCLLNSKGPARMKGLMDDILTDNEWNEISRRIMAAQYLRKCVSYRQIMDMTGISSAALAKMSKKMIRDRIGLLSVLENLRNLADKKKDILPPEYFSRS